MTLTLWVKKVQEVLQGHSIKISPNHLTASVPRIMKHLTLSLKKRPKERKHSEGQLLTKYENELGPHTRFYHPHYKTAIKSSAIMQHNYNTTANAYFVTGEHADNSLVAGIQSHKLMPQIKIKNQNESI